ncbi:MAG: DEAD/DEAH box helicase, partial [Anaerolineae bacterium]
MSGFSFFAPFEYQIRAAQITLRRFRGRGLLCDEVGLGKTIEVGLVLKEYLMRHMIERILILTPPALVEQWREEMAAKFGLPDFVTNYDPEFRELSPQAWAELPRVIASLATARRAEHRRAITSVVYDLVIIDEAHHLKNRSSVSWKLVNALQKKYILFLTATPVQNRLEELYNPITILKPGQLKTPREFRRQFVVQGDPRLPKNRGRLRELLADVMVRHARGQVGIQLPPRHAHTVRLKLSPEEQAFYEDVSAFVRSCMTRPEDEGKLSTAHRFTLRILQREIGSSPTAARPTLLALARHDALSADRDTLLALAECADQITAWAKGAALEKLLLAQLAANSSEKQIIFTHFRATLDMLAELLRRMDVNFVLYVVFNFKLALITDEKREQLVPVMMDLQAGHAVADRAQIEALMLLEDESAFGRLPSASLRWMVPQPSTSNPLTGPVLSALLERATRAALAEVAIPLERLQRRATRHLELARARLTEYYDGLSDDLRRRIARASDDERRSTLADQLEALQVEREAKLADVEAKHHLRVEATLVNLMVITQPKMLLPVQIGDRHTKIERTVVWDPLLHQLESLACDVCGQPGERLFLCAGSHLVHEECLLAQQCVDCKRLYCHLCAEQMSQCAVCERPVCER